MTDERHALFERIRDHDGEWVVALSDMTDDTPHALWWLQDHITFEDGDLEGEIYVYMSDEVYEEFEHQVTMRAYDFWERYGVQVDVGREDSIDIESEHDLLTFLLEYHDKVGVDIYDEFVEYLWKTELDISASETAMFLCLTYWFARK